MNWGELLNEKRPRKSTSQEDHRSQFERDHDRCIFSTPVKRLQDKAQVFPLEPHDAVRTRLTHSLEVSSVARGLALGAAKDMIDEGRLTGPEAERNQKKRDIEAIAATTGLLHDIGNPPFGHAGEEAIQHWFASRFPDGLSELLGDQIQLATDFTSFEGNAQTLRLVTKLQILADFNGLNLTYGTLSALLKYTAASHETEENGDHAKSKPGYFASEIDIVSDIRKETGTGTSRNPITFLVEAADDITYSVADIEDAVKKGILRWDFIENELKKSELGKQVISGAETILRAGQSSIPAGLDDDVYASAFRTAAIGILVSDARQTFRARYDDIMAGTYMGELVKDGSTNALLKLLKKDIGAARVYTTSSTLKLELMGREVICDLMDTFWEGAQKIGLDGTTERSFSGKIAALMSSNYKRVFSHYVGRSGLPEDYHRLQLVTDYVCGMTDTFAKELHSELKNG
jgi:dGTPase